MSLNLVRLAIQHSVFLVFQQAVLLFKYQFRIGLDLNLTCNDLWTRMNFQKQQTHDITKVEKCGCYEIFDNLDLFQYLVLKMFCCILATIWFLILYFFKKKKELEVVFDLCTQSIRYLQLSKCLVVGGTINFSCRSLVASLLYTSSFS